MLSCLLPLTGLLYLLLPEAAAHPAQRVPPFPYTAPKPVNGHPAGVVELGLTASIPTWCGRWQLEKAVYGRSYVLANVADPAATVRQYATQQQAAGVASGTTRGWL